MFMIWLHNIDPIALHLPFEHFQGIHWYGITYLLGFFAAWWWGARRVRAGHLPNINSEQLSDLLFYAMVGVVIGGRLGYIFFYSFDELLRDPLFLFKINKGGMSFHGGLLGVMTAVLWWSRKHQLHVFDTMDFIAPLVAPGLGFGRIGNYIGGELWGKLTHSDWGVIFPRALPAEWANQSPTQLYSAYEAHQLDQFARHPSQLYQAGLEGVVMLLVLMLLSRKPRARYFISGWFAILYGVFRFIVEFVREPDADIGYLAWNWLTMGQVLSLPMIVVGIVLLWLSRKAPVLRA
jgi:phosphatidylglycerol---prolipoprotein diacylglyceryl transferase